MKRNKKPLDKKVLETGFFYVRQDLKSGRWTIIHEFSVNGQRRFQTLAEETYNGFGIRKTMSVGTVRKKIQTINKERNFEKQKLQKAARRAQEFKSLNETLFPQDFVDDFKTHVEKTTFGSETHLKKLWSHFRYVQKMMKELSLSVGEYQDNAKIIFKYFKKQRISVNYSCRIVSMANTWGRFVSRRTKSFFEEIPMPRGVVRSAIADAQKTKRGKDTELGVRTASRSLNPRLLKKKAGNFTNPLHVNWLKISLWFGLRPSEVDSLHDEKWRVYRDRATGVKVLVVYQSKLMGISEEERYKHIPVIFEEQVECLELIEDGEFKRPHCKTVRKNIGERYGTYAGRKGFTDLMLDRGQELKDVSIWLGHKSIETTWKKYKDKNEIRFTRTDDLVA